MYIVSCMIIHLGNISHITRNNYLCGGRTHHQVMYLIESVAPLVSIGYHISTLHRLRGLIDRVLEERSFLRSKPPLL